MKNKTPLFLTELLIMLLVFAIAAALCLRTFSKAELISLENETRDNAVVEVQNIAQFIKAHHGLTKLEGEFDGEEWLVDKGAFKIRITERESANALLGTADITAIDTDGETVFAIEVSFQKEAAE